MSGLGLLLWLVLAVLVAVLVIVGAILIALKKGFNEVITGLQAIEERVAETEPSGEPG